MHHLILYTMDLYTMDCEATIWYHGASNLDLQNKVLFNIWALNFGVMTDEVLPQILWYWQCELGLGEIKSELQKSTEQLRDGAKPFGNLNHPHFDPPDLRSGSNPVKNVERKNMS